MNSKSFTIIVPPRKRWYPQPPNHSEADPAKKVHEPATDSLLTTFLYCHGTRQELEQRIAARKNHFMGAQMLDSQLATLEDPRREEGVGWVDISASKEEVGRRAVAEIKRMLEWAETQEG
jgi:gluconokinase